MLTNVMRLYKPGHDILWGYPRGTQRLRPGTCHAHPRILTNAALGWHSGSRATHTHTFHHSSLLASHTISSSQVFHHFLMHGFSVLPRGLPLSLAAGAALGGLSRRPLARPGHRLLLFCLTASRVPVRRPLRRCRHPSHVCGRTTGRARRRRRRRRRLGGTLGVCVKTSPFT